MKQVFTFRQWSYAPRGQTPVLRVKLTRDHLSVIGGITEKGRIFMQMQERAYQAEDVVRFLRLLLHKVSGNLLVIWDGSSIHRAEMIKVFLASREGKRVHLERLPGYAPELNPQEQVWNLLKPPALLFSCASPGIARGARCSSRQWFSFVANAG
jgi:transposase